MNYVNEKNQIDKIISSAEKIAIVSHIKPDLDAIGSCIAVKYYIDKYHKSKENNIYFTAPIKDTIKNLSEVKGIENINEVDDIENLVSNYDTFIFLDGSVLERFTNKHDTFNLQKIKSICIDHHRGEPSNFNFYHRDVNYSSCTQLVADILFTDNDLKDKNLAEPLIFGIYSDTGSLKYISARKSSVFITLKRIIENSDIDVQQTLSKIEFINPNDFEFLKEYINNTKMYNENNNVPDFVYTYLTKETALKLRSIDQVTTANDQFKYMFLKKIKGYNWGYITYPVIKENYIRISFRSLPNGVNVNQLAKLFNGGGHLLASAAKIYFKDLNLKEEEFIKLSSKEICNHINEKIINAFENNQIEIFD